METPVIICADEDQNLDRFRAQMVLCAIEQGLGSVAVQQCSQLLAGDAVVRQVGALISLDEKDPLTREAAQIVVAEAYLKQVFDLAIAATKGTPNCDCLKELYRLAEALELFEIRNAAAHSNRPFFRYFWLRTAAFASDPRFARLNLLEIGEKLHRAFAGQIERPPEKWFANVSQVANNLPGRFEHWVTGLVGRDEERKRLWLDLGNPRKHFISIVSPGGNGKTALVLEFLNELTTSTQGSTLVDAVIFVSMKMQALTASGTVEMRCSRTLAELENEITNEICKLFSEECGDFLSAKEKFQNYKVVLCVDNLETILTDNPDALAPFESSLPKDWKLIVTSRIPVENASTLPLTPLKPAAAKQLVRSYIMGCGYPRPDEKLVEAIVAGTKSNPLAIKLVVDTYIGGKDITESISKAAEDTTEFSFSNLLNVLSDDAIDVMESLFVYEEISRMGLVEALGIPIEQVGNAIQSLCRTSLAYREHFAAAAKEIIRLNEQVRELLRLKPKRISTREKIEKYLRSQRANLQNLGATTDTIENAYDLFYIDPKLPPDLQILLKTVNKVQAAAKAPAHLQDAYRKMMLAENEYSSYAVYWRSRARLMWACRDHTAAYKCIECSLEIAPSDFVTRRLLAEWLISESRAEEALSISEKLISDGGANPEKCGIAYAGHILAVYLHSLIFVGQFETVNQKTQRWFEHQPLDFFEAVARIRCFKRWAEDRSAPESESRIIHALNTFASAATVYGIPAPMETVGGELVKELLFIGRNCLEDRSVEYVRTSAAFIGRFLRDLADPSDELWAEISSLFPKYQKLMTQLQPPRIEEHSPESLDIENTYVSNGYTIANISVIPPFFENHHPSFMFAVDKNGDDYFLHASAFNKQNRIAWADLKNGASVALKRELSTRGSAKWRATEIEAVAI